MTDIEMVALAGRVTVTFCVFVGFVILGPLLMWIEGFEDTAITRLGVVLGCMGLIGIPMLMAAAAGAGLFE